MSQIDLINVQEKERERKRGREREGEKEQDRAASIDVLEIDQPHTSVLL